MQDYLQPLAKSQVWWRAFGQKIRSEATLGGRSGLLLMVLAQAGHQPYSTVAATPFCGPMWGLPTGLSPCPWRGPLFSTLSFSLTCGRGPVFCLATLHLEESEAAEMCTTHGRNYLAHLTSEIFFFLFLLSLPFPQITPRLGKLIDSLCK